MKQRLFLTIAALFCLIAGYAGNLAANDITMKPGETTALELSLASSVSGLCGVQFEIKLPDGFSLEKGSDDQVYKMSANQADDLTCNEYDLGDGAYRFIVYSSTLQELKGGSLMGFNLKADETLTYGNYTVTISNVALSDYEGTVTKKDGLSAGIKVTDFFTLSYKVDGEDYKSYEIEYGTSITPEADPTKEGYTFSGWSEIPETMPANDVTITGSFTINKYKLTYMVDDDVYKSYELEFGATITPEAEPTKEGYTFSGWGNIPSTMPAYDVTVSGTFSKGAYKLIYMVDGEVYKTISYDYGATITPEAEPTKEGYTFSGWSEIPEIMPAKDVTVTGCFTINKYKLTYMIDGVEYKSYEIEYGASITPEVEPTKEGYTFSGWSEIPSTMPANDVTVTGTFTVNSYKLTYMIDDDVYKEVMYEYGATITPEPQPDGNYVSFEWIGLPETMPANDVTVYASYETGIINVLVPQGVKAIYAPNGKKLDKLQKGVNIILMIDGKRKKVMVK